jgi:hypothetical protein
MKQRDCRELRGLQRGSSPCARGARRFGFFSSFFPINSWSALRIIIVEVDTNN